MKNILLASAAILGLASAAAACGSYEPGCTGGHDGGYHRPALGGSTNGWFSSDVMSYGGANGIGNVMNKSFAETYTKSEQQVWTEQSGGTCGTPDCKSFGMSNFIGAGSIAGNRSEDNSGGGAASLSRSTLEGFFNSGVNFGR